MFEIRDKRIRQAVTVLENVYDIKFIDLSKVDGCPIFSMKKHLPVKDFKPYLGNYEAQLINSLEGKEYKDKDGNKIFAYKIFIYERHINKLLLNKKLKKVNGFK